MLTIYNDNSFDFTEDFFYIPIYNITINACDKYILSFKNYDFYYCYSSLCYYMIHKNGDIEDGVQLKKEDTHKVSHKLYEKLKSYKGEK